MTSTFTHAQPGEPFTADRLLKLMADMPPIPPDPLNGVTMLWVHPDDKDACVGAMKLADAANGNPFMTPRVRIEKDQNALRGWIFGFKEKAGALPELVLEIKLGKD